jgi:hypothetical protein
MKPAESVLTRVSGELRKHEKGEGQAVTTAGRRGLYGRHCLTAAASGSVLAPFSP